MGRRERIEAGDRYRRDQEERERRERLKPQPAPAPAAPPPAPKIGEALSSEEQKRRIHSAGSVLYEDKDSYTNQQLGPVELPRSIADYQTYKRVTDPGELSKKYGQTTTGSELTPEQRLGYYRSQESGLEYQSRLHKEKMVYDYDTTRKKQLQTLESKRQRPIAAKRENVKLPTREGLSRKKKASDFLNDDENKNLSSLLGF